MPDFGQSQKVTSKSVTIASNGDRNDGTVNVNFDTRQADKIYFYRKMNAQVPTTNILATSIAGSWNNLSNSVDKNRSSLADNGGNDGTIRLNFQNEIARKVGIRVLLGGNPGNGWNLYSKFAGSDVSFSSETLILSSHTSGNTGVVDIFPSSLNTTLQYVELRFDELNNANQMGLYEVWDAKEGYGSSNINIQIQNKETGTWITMDTLPVMNYSIAEIIDIFEIIHPDADHTRIQLVNSGKWNGSVSALLVNPRY